MPPILIDGYNLIRQSASLSRIEAKNFEGGRTALINRLAVYHHLKGHPITVVFDGGGGSSTSLQEYSEKGITVIYTAMDRSADDLLIEMAQKIRGGAVVVTSDRTIQKAASGAGCGVLESWEFEKMLNNVGANLVFAPGRSQGSPLQETMFKPEDEDEEPPIHKRFLTKKKGPSKRLPKAKRRALNRL